MLSWNQTQPTEFRSKARGSSLCTLASFLVRPRFLQPLQKKPVTLHLVLCFFGLIFLFTFQSSFGCV
jgi:hypothetical protein